MSLWGVYLIPRDVTPAEGFHLFTDDGQWIAQPLPEQGGPVVGGLTSFDALVDYLEDNDYLKD